MCLSCASESQSSVPSKCSATSSDRALKVDFFLSTLAFIKVFHFASQSWQLAYIASRHACKPTQTLTHTHTYIQTLTHVHTHTHSTHTYCHAHYIHANTHTVMHNTYTQTLKYLQILIYTHTFTYKFAPIHLYSNMHAHQCITRTCIDILSVSSFCQLFSFLSFSPILSSLTVSISVPLNLSLFSISCTEHHLFLIYIPSIPISQLILDSPLLFPFLSPF